MPGRQGKPQDRGARHRRYRMDNRRRDQRRYLGRDPADIDIAAAIGALLEQRGIDLPDGEPAAAWSGMDSLGGYVGSPVFRLGEETFVGRQHLPLIRARLSG